jgi:hypothetical protein
VLDQPSLLEGRKITAHRALSSGLWPDVTSWRSSILGRIGTALAGRLDRTPGAAWQPGGTGLGDVLELYPAGERLNHG